MPCSIYQGMLMQPEKKILLRLSELPTMPSTIGNMAWNETGYWRYLTPLIANKLAPAAELPVGHPDPKISGCLRRGDVQRSLSLLLSHNLCQGSLVACAITLARQNAFAKLSIERYLYRRSKGFWPALVQKRRLKRAQKTGKRVAIVGSGPLGLSCAFFLGRLGCEVVVMEPSNQLGDASRSLTEEIEPEVLEDEIKRLLVLADIGLERGAVIDFEHTGETLRKADLIILDLPGFRKISPCLPRRPHSIRSMTQS